VAAVSRATDLVIFDCDGVLVDSEVISNRVLAEMLTTAGLPTTLTDSRREYQGMLLADIRARVEDKLGNTLPDDWIARYEAERDAAFAGELQAVAYSAEAVAQISAAGIAVCVASQSKLSKIDLVLALTGLDRLFPPRARFSSYSVPKGKPAPDVFLHAASTMGAEPPACLVVEDTPSGVMAGVAAGMRVIGYAGDSDETTLTNAGAQVVSSMAEIPRLVGVD
jgi:HAD superfamily hydrolase (TIGR01509 family)